MKRITSFTLLALISSTSYMGATTQNSETATWTASESESGSSWTRLQSTLNDIDSTQGKEAPSLGLTFVVGERLHKVDLKPAELLSVMTAVDAAMQGDWETVSTQAQSSTVRHLLPAAAEMFRAHEVAARSPAANPSELNAGLTNNSAYQTLADLVTQKVADSSEAGTPYLPSVLVSADPAYSETMRAFEDLIFAQWDSSEEVREELMSPDTASQLLRSLGRYPRGNREIFNHFLTAFVEEQSENVWNTFDAINRRLGQSQANAVQDEIVRSSYLALEKSRQNSARPQNLFVEVFSNENNNRSRVQVNEPVGIGYTYDIGSGVPHTMWLSIRDKDDTVIYEKTFKDLKFDSSHQRAKVTLPGLSFSGNFQALLTIRNEHGHFTHRSDSFRVVDNLTAADQERYDTLEDLFGAASQEANSLVERLQTLASGYDALHPELLTSSMAIETTTSEIEADNMTNSPEENIAKWLHSGRYDGYEAEVEAYNENVENSDELLAEGKAIKERLAAVEELTRPLADALDHETLETGLQAALQSPVTEELGFGEKVRELSGIEPVAEAVVEEAMETTEEVSITEAVETTEELSSNESISQVNNYQEELVSAALGNNLEAAAEALNNGASINVISEGSEHILHQVVQSENLTLATVEFLVNNGADIHVSNSSGTTPMMALALSTNLSSDREAVLRYFIEKGVHFNSLALKTVQNKEERAVALESEVESLSDQGTSTPYLYNEAVSLLREAVENERAR